MEFFPRPVGTITTLQMRIGMALGAFSRVKTKGERGIKRASETHNFQQVDLNSPEASHASEHAAPSGREFDKRKREDDDGEEEGLCRDAVKRIGVNRGHRLGGS